MVQTAPCPGQKGFTLVEALVAFTLLISGTAFFLWQLRQKSHSVQHQREFLFALESAQSDLESLQTLHPDWVHDTAYDLNLPNNRRFRLNRRVYDTLDFSESREELRLGSDLQPLALQEPREVQVTVTEADTEADWVQRSLDWSQSLWGEKSSEASRPLVKLTTRLPEYLP
jgi:type II secretory pathway pseudopilin PulG